MSGGTADRLRALATAGRTALWPLPVAAVVLALAAGVVLPLLDRAVDDDSPTWVTDILFSGGPGAARTVLDAISSSMITVTSLTFSLTVVTLQLASSQFSPRLLRTFTRDRFVHATLAVFLATFTYALTVERTVRSADEGGGGAFVPRLSVTVGFVLTIASVISLVLFLAHLASEIRVETMLETVHQDASATARAVLGGSRPRGPVSDALTDDPRRVLHPPETATALLARRSGFLVRVDEDELLTAVTKADALLVVELLPGAPVAAGTPLAWAWAASGGPLDEAAQDGLEDCLASAVVVGPERTEAQDISFGLRQLTDVAVKALSPGINDPTTAVHALGHSSAFLCELVGQDLGPKGLRDEGQDQGGDDGDGDGRLRVVVARPALPDLLDLAVGQPRRYGAADPTVVASLFSLLRAVAWSAATSPAGTAGTAGALEAVEGQRQRLLATAEAAADGGDHDPDEAAALRVRDTEVRQALAGTWRHTTSGAGAGSAGGAHR